MRYFLTGCFLLVAIASMAQPGLNEMQQAQSDLSSSFFSALDCSLVLAAIFGILGAVRIYHNWQMGHPADRPGSGRMVLRRFIYGAGRCIPAGPFSASDPCNLIPQITPAVLRR
jgi:hypothetical protein